MRMDGLQRFSFNEPTKIIYGEGSLSELKDELLALRARSVVIICDGGVAKAGLADKAIAAIGDVSGMTVHLYDKIIANPLDTTMDEAFDFAVSVKADTIVGIGGGSALDSAKGVALLMTNGGKMRDYLMDDKVVSKMIAPFIAIPTTAGTGSEVTRTVVATDHISRFKNGFKYGDTMFARVAILDPLLMAGLPAPVLAACAMDALTHAIESYTTWKGNPLTDSLNLCAIQLIGDNIRKAFSNAGDTDAKGKLLLASCITGIAFDQAGLGLAHCMGHPMGGLFNIAHGVACGMSLPVVMDFNAIASPEKFARIAIELGENTEGLTKMEAAHSAARAVRKMLSDLELPMTLSDVGISADDIPKLAKDAMGFPGMRGANPRAIDQKGVEKLFEKLLKRIED